ncbi:MAG TPA: hypothetical protein VNW50_23130 [Streptosporangiaceae bacterium]|nr:hypothetical protein [Streptosporangiaceae bacterium]
MPSRADGYELRLAAGRATAGVATGSLLRVEKGDRQFWALDVGIVTEAGKGD